MDRLINLYRTTSATEPIVIEGERHQVVGVYFDPIAGRYDSRGPQAVHPCRRTSALRATLLDMLRKVGVW